MTHASRMNYHTAAPQAVQALITFAHSSAPSLEPELLELMRLRISQVNGCAVCLDMHAAALARLGAAPRRLHTVAGWRDAPRLFSAREQAALAWAEAVNAIPQRSPSDAEFHALREHFSEQQLAELSCAVTAIRAFNMLNVSFQMPVPEQPYVGGRS